MLVNRSPLTVLLIVLGTQLVIAQPRQLVDKFERRSFTSDSLTMGYRLFVPESYDVAKQYPLVLTLHGSGDQGSDNERQISSHRIATSWADPVNQSRWPAFVVSPQLPSGHNWRVRLNFEDVGVDGPQPASYTVMALLDSLENEFNIDPDRIYITGLSLGGAGTWSLSTLEPERFAAAIPMSSGFFPAYAHYYDRLPMWIFHGERDAHALAEFSRSMVAAFMDRGRTALFTNCGIDPTDCDPISVADFAEGVTAHADVLYTGYPDGYHEIWTESYDDPRLAPWVFSQHRRVKDGVQISSPSGYPTWSGMMAVNWARTDLAETGELWLSIDNGESWTLVDSTVINSGTTVLETDAFEDTPLARVRLLFRDADGFVHKRETSTPFAIDNTGNGRPFVSLAKLPFVGHPDLSGDQFELRLSAGDPEGKELEATVLVSVDGGGTFDEVESVSLPTVSDQQSIELSLVDLPNTNKGVLAVRVSDGDSTAEDRTQLFSKHTSGLSTTNEVPSSIRALTNYPNPFEAMTTINFELVEPADISLQVFDVLGRVVARLRSGPTTAGRHSAEWNTSNHESALPAGLYFCRLSAIHLDGSISTAVGMMTLVR